MIEWKEEERVRQVFPKEVRRVKAPCFFSGNIDYNMHNSDIRLDIDGGFVYNKI